MRGGTCRRRGLAGRSLFAPRVERRTQDDVQSAVDGAPPALGRTTHLTVNRIVR
ncbi:hypothetical protein LXT21_05510 [Myxococcus sp. K38C18041901]|uniref:hypothetical protein n=1 Tax=Myxococcus guangdongensis TaxID=2906760 RepID=UPI0020A7920C|nr:hypothetical protein [Myxococcus guangdongensis]MCP3058217.1 hypothetical protein [Myxococcus guangdongensis]